MSSFEQCSYVSYASYHIFCNENKDSLTVYLQRLIGLPFSLPSVSPPVLPQAECMVKIITTLCGFEGDRKVAPDNFVFFAASLRAQKGIEAFKRMFDHLNDLLSMSVMMIRCMHNTMFHVPPLDVMCSRTLAGDDEHRASAL